MTHRALVLLLLAVLVSPPLAPAQEPSPGEKIQPVVSDLRRLHAWRGRWYNATGTSLLVTSTQGEWTELAALPDRVTALAGAPHSLAAAGRNFLWSKPKGKGALPVLAETAGDWVALSPTADGWVALSTHGELAEFGAGRPPEVHAVAGVGRFNDLVRAWDQWWLAGQRAGDALILTSTSLSGPWTDASPGGKSPLVRIATVRGALLAFAADGRVYRAVEGEPWQPVSAAYQAGGMPPLSVAANDEEGLVTLSPDALRQTLDGLHWNVLPYPVDEYNSQTLVSSDHGLVLASAPPAGKPGPLLLEPSTPYSAFRLAQAYAAGDGVPVEPDHAVTLFRQAAQAGLGRAKLELAFLIASEQVKGADPLEASALFLEVADEPPERMAPADAYQHLRRKALRPHGPSQGVLAVLSRLGFGCKADSIEATAWMLLAEEHQSNLYDLSWYRDADDPAEAADKRAAELRAEIKR